MSLRVELGTFTDNEAGSVWKVASRAPNGQMPKIDGTLFGRGTFDSGTLTLQVYDGHTWHAVTGAALTAAGEKTFTVFGFKLRGITSGGGGSINVIGAVVCNVELVTDN